MIKLLAIMSVLFILAGCASTRKETRDTQIQQLQMEISSLKDQLRQKDEDIGYLEGRLAKAQRQKAVVSVPQHKPKSSQNKVVKMNPKDIQVALKKAGCYNGPIDGKIGKATKKAIRDFQKANGLAADGVVGRQTREKLAKYLN